MDLTRQDIRAMREWIGEIDWRDSPDLTDLTDEDVVGTVEAHYAGGVQQFQRDIGR